MVQPRYFEAHPHVENPRSARNAADRRMVRKSRARYASIVRVTAVLGCVLLLLMGYVVMTSNLTGLSYAIAGAQAKREALQEETMRLDDRIAALRSDDRLFAVAARLGMRQSERFAFVRLPGADVAARPERFALLSSLTGFFRPTAVRQR